MPTLCVIGGCNGAGKTTLARGRLRLRVRLGGHDVPEEDILRRHARSVRHFCKDYLPLADEWGVWDNAMLPPVKFASSDTHTAAEAIAMLTSPRIREVPPQEESEMTLAPEKPKRIRGKRA